MDDCDNTGQDTPSHMSETFFLQYHGCVLFIQNRITVFIFQTQNNTFCTDQYFSVLDFLHSANRYLGENTDMENPDCDYYGERTMWGPLPVV